MSTNIQNGKYRCKKKLYREIGKGKIDLDEPPAESEIIEFWNSIWGKEMHFNNAAEWIDREKERMNAIDEQHWKTKESAELSAAFAKYQKWKSPDVDQIPNFWLYSPTPINNHLVHCFTTILQNPDVMPDWLTEGITYLLPKSQQTKNPKNYRPITCLTMMYKLLTSILTNRMYSLLEQNQLVPQEQKGCVREALMAVKTNSL